jgi:hypothetical protein
MRGLVEYRDQQCVNKPFVIWQYILFDWNDSDEEIQRAKKMAGELGVDVLLWTLTHTPGASKRFTPDADIVGRLVSRDGVDNGRTRLVWAPSVPLAANQSGQVRGSEEWMEFHKRIRSVCHI